MITSKQRAYLRKLSNTLEPIFQIGKSGVTDSFVMQIDEALEARELIKIHVLETAFLDTKETCNSLASLCNAEPVQAIGSKFVLYRESTNNKRIEIPKR